VADWSTEKRRWYDAADRRALPVGLAVFVLAGAVFLLDGLGWWSLLTALAFGCVAVNVTAGRARLRARRRDRDDT
jgi:predicted membrane metal-binding protein